MKYLVIFLIIGTTVFFAHNYAFGWCDQDGIQSDDSCHAPYQDFPLSKRVGLSEDAYAEMEYSQFLKYCEGHLRSFTESMTPLERQLSLLCNGVDVGFTEKQWVWLNGAELDWEAFARNASEHHAYQIPEFVDSGIKETLRIDSFVSGRDSFPPPMIAMISFDYEKLSQVIHYDKKFEICGNGNLIPYEGFINCSDEYVTYDSTKEETFSVPKFAKNIPLPEHTRQQMLDWCKNSPKWAKIDKRFWDVVPTRILSTIPEFESLKGKIDSIVVHSYSSEDTCPPNVWMAGTFTSENGDKHKFSLYHDSDFFRYDIDGIQCRDGLVLVTKSSDGSPACVKPDTKQKLIERGWAKLIEYKIRNNYDGIRNHPTVKAFYAKYPNTIEEIRSDHISYVTGNDDGFKVRMKLYFDENYELDHIDFHCYFQREHQNDVPESFILRYLKDFECEKRPALAVVTIPYGSGNPENQFHLIPEEITVVLGKNSTVHWTNNDDTPSTLTSDSLDWSTGMIKPGESAYVIFNETGVYPYHGEPHPWKVGKVIVLAE